MLPSENLFKTLSNDTKLACFVYKAPCYNSLQNFSPNLHLHVNSPREKTTKTLELQVHTKHVHTSYNAIDTYTLPLSLVSSSLFDATGKPCSTAERRQFFVRLAIKCLSECLAVSLFWRRVAPKASRFLLFVRFCIHGEECSRTAPVFRFSLLR